MVKMLLKVRVWAAAFIIFSASGVYAQSFLGLDGGFEGTATIDNTNNSQGAQSGKWTRAGTVS